MEHIYTKEQDRCELISTRAQRIKFLLDYSRSLKVLNHNGMAFENHLN